jgi:Family of unknown function (DUF5832)
MNINMSAFEKKTLDNGSPNPKYIDLCDEDPPIAGQKFACISFVSPEKILKKREIYLFDEFVKQWEFAKSMEKFSEFVQFMCYKYSLKPDDVMKNYDEFKTEEQSKLREASVLDDYKNFLDKHEDNLNEQFNREHAFQTSVRGLKLRGVFPTQEEAEMKCKKLREMDPHHDIFVGPVGMWMPWDPDAYKTGRMEYMEEQLNELHKAKLENEEKAKQEFDRRIKETKKKAIEENIKLAAKSGNVLTQTIDKEGNLIGVKETVNFEEREVADAESTRLYNEALYENANKANEDTVENLPVD